VFQKKSKNKSTITNYYIHKQRINECTKQDAELFAPNEKQEWLSNPAMARSGHVLCAGLSLTFWIPTMPCTSCADTAASENAVMSDI